MKRIAIPSTMAEVCQVLRCTFGLPASGDLQIQSEDGEDRSKAQFAEGA